LFTIRTMYSGISITSPSNNSKDILLKRRLIYLLNIFPKISYFLCKYMRYLKLCCKLRVLNFSKKYHRLHRCSIWDPFPFKINIFTYVMDFGYLLPDVKFGTKI
jgi:hypothetical protein